MGCERVIGYALPEGDTVEGMFHLHLDPLPRLVGQARRFVAEHAPPLPEDTRDALLLLTSELVTNAVLHARTPLVLGITIGTGSVLVTVHDKDLARPEQHLDDAREGGWGLGLVAALSEESALEAHGDGGKTAWFRLTRGASPYAADGVAERDERGGV